MPDLLRTVLVVDDNPGDARLVDLTLSQDAPGRYQVERAGRIADALPRLKENVVAVLLDLGLPDSKGTEGLARIRAQAPRVAVFVLSGREDPETARAAYEAGAQEYQVKGLFPPGELDRRIRVAVAAQRLEEQIRGGASPDPADLSDLDAAQEGAAVVGPRGATAVNERFAELAGSPTDAKDPVTGWLALLRRELDDAHTTLHGWTTRPGADGAPVALEYLIRRVRAPGSEGVLVRLHARGTGAPGPARDGDAGNYRSGALDDAILTQLSDLGGGDPEFLPELMATFFRESAELVHRLSGAAERGDGPAMAAAAHTLKSAAAQVGALHLSRLAAELERRATAGEVEPGRVLVGKIGRELGRIEEDPRAQRRRAGR